MGLNQNMIDLVVNYFKDSECDADQRKLGIEVEHFILERDSLEATTYYQRKPSRISLRTQCYLALT